MAFVEELFPESISYGARGGAGFRTEIVTNPGGHEQRTQRWSRTLGQWQVGFQNRTAADTETFVAFFYAVARGRANGFRFKDGVDHLGTDEPIGTGDGADATWQLFKRYTFGGQSFDRTVYKPVPGTVVMKLNGTPTVAFTVNTATGLVTFTSPPGAGVVITADFQFHIPVRLGIDDLSGLRYVTYDTYSWDDISLQEIRDIA